MYRMGEEEIQAVAAVMRNRSFHRGNEKGVPGTQTFEADFKKYANAEHFFLTTSGKGALICAGGAFILALCNLFGEIWNVPMWIVIGLSFIIPKNKVIRVAKVVSIGILFGVSIAQIIASAMYPHYLTSVNPINYGVLLETVINHLLNIFPVYLSLLLFSPYKKVKN